MVKFMIFLKLVAFFSPTVLCSPFQKTYSVLISLQVGKKTRGMTARNSLALSRTIVSSNMAKGNPENLPFWPGL